MIGSTSATQTDTEAVPHVIVDRVAEAVDCAPTELPPLYETVDPDALERVIESNSNVSALLTFSYYGFTVTVSADRTVTLVPNQERTSSEQ